MTVTERPWIGSWRLVRHAGFHEWLTPRGASSAEASSNVDSLMNHTELRISCDGDGVLFEWVTNVRGRLRRARTEVRYSLDGVTPTILDGPAGPVSFTARVDGNDLVHSGGSVALPTETHRRHVEDDLMIQTMSVEGSAKEDGTWSELIWERSRSRH